jgi:hypothetical protein
MPTKTECQELADDILKRITWYPESYNQSTWQTLGRSLLKKLLPKGGSTRKLIKERPDKKPTLQNCQTTGCIAGTASILAGDIPSVWLTEEGVSGTGSLMVESVITEDGQERTIQARGAELLCLSTDEQDWLFSASRTVPEVVYALREISAGKPISGLYEMNMTREQKAEIVAYRHQLRQQKPKVNYVATNKLVPRAVKEAAEAKKATAGPQARP